MSGHERLPAAARRRSGEKSAATREAAILSLLAGQTIVEAAQTAGIGERTLRRWLTADPAFQADYAAGRRAVFEAGLARVESLVAKAAAVLDELLAPATPPAVRLGAVRAVLDVGVHERDAAAILSRLDEIERTTKSKGKV